MSAKNEGDSNFDKQNWKGLSIYYLCKSFRKTNISDPLIRPSSCAYQGVKNVSFPEKFAYLLNGWSQWSLPLIL